MDNNTVYCNDRNTENLNLINRKNEPYNVYAFPSPQNVVYKSDSIAKVYESAFGGAIDDYNSKSARKGEIIYTRNTYFEYLFGVSPDSETAQKCLTSNKRGSDKTRSFNEVFVQIGDRKGFGHVVRDDSGNNATNPKAKEILEIFYKGGRFQKISDNNGTSFLIRVNKEDEDSIIIPSFEERNPNFHVVTAIEHNDDLLGVPYLHIKFVPVGTNYGKGPSKQLGFHRALADMGFTNKQTAFTKWIQKERFILETICGYYGIEANTEHKIVRISDCLTEDCINESTTECKVAEEKANTIIERAKQEASDIRERANSDAEKIISDAEKAAKEIISNAEQDFNETKCKYEEAFALSLRYIEMIMQNSQTQADIIYAREMERAEKERENLRQKEKELEKAQKKCYAEYNEYHDLRSKQMEHILIKAQKIAERALAKFAEQDQGTKTQQLKTSFAEYNFEELKKLCSFDQVLPRQTPNK